MHASPQKAPADSSIKVLLLGTVHLDNPGRDVNNPRVPDVLQARKQVELQNLRDALARFEPTKMALEVKNRHQAGFDSLYRAFRAGRLDTNFAVGEFSSVRSEQYQLGFRLAKRLGHEHVWAVDHFIPMQIGRVTSYAREHDPDLARYLKQFRNGPLMTNIDSLLQHGTLPSLYRYINRPSTLQLFRAPYARMAEAKIDTSFIGADVVAQYHKRNLRIFANIAEIAEPGDRIIAIFGAGHMPYLRAILEVSPRIELVDPLEYLPQTGS